MSVATRPLPVAAGAPSEYLPLDPVRVLDTRQPPAKRLGAGGVQTISLAGLVPAGSRAAAVSLTSADPAAPGFLTADGCGQRPDASSANYAPGGARAAFVVVPLDADGRLCVYSSAATDLIVDLQGAFVGDPESVGRATRFTPGAPVRLVDTRATGRAAMLVMAAPAGSSGVAINLTATGGSAQGYLAAFPCGGTVPVVSNVNFLAGETVAGSAFVPVGADGNVCVLSSVPVDVIVDLTGTFAPGGALAYTPTSPTRVFDTRNAIGGWSPVQGIGQTIDVRAAPDDGGRRDRHRDDGRPARRRVRHRVRLRGRACDVERQRRRGRGARQLGHRRSGSGGTAVHPHLDDVARVVRRVGVVEPVSRSTVRRCTSRSSGGTR